MAKKDVGGFAVSIERAALIKVLARANDVVERRTTVPILANVLIEAGNDVLRVTASDLDIEIVEVAQAAVEGQGKTTVSARFLFDIARKLPSDGPVKLSMDAGGKLIVTGGRSRFSLPVLPVDDFPTLAAAEMPTHFAIDAAVLRRIIDTTRFAICTEETRYYLNGIYLHLDSGASGELRAAATDGHRLARVGIAQPEGAGDMPGVIVPRKTVATLRKMLDGVDGAVEIALSTSKVRFHLGEAVLTSKLIDGTFPDYTRVIPTSNDKLLRCDPKALAKCLERVTTIATEKTRSVKVGLEKDKLTLTVSSPENGTAIEELPCDYASAPIEVGFNARYMLDVLTQIEGDVVEMHLHDAAAPTMVRESEGSPALFVVMPMRV